MIYNTAYLINSTPETVACAHCKAVTLCGLDYGMTYKVDPAPLNVHGEIAARRNRRRIYRLIAGQITYRELEHLRTNDPVLAEHRCEPVDPEHVAPEHIPAIRNLIPEPEPQKPLTLVIDPSTGTLKPAHTDDQPPY